MRFVGMEPPVVPFPSSSVMGSSIRAFAKILLVILDLSSAALVLT